MARELRCGDVVQGCDGVVRGTDDEDVMRQAATHAAEAHGMTEVDEGTAASLQAAIHDA
jgi:predicted small metal-binding protein